MNPFTQYKPWMIEHYGAPLFRIPVEIAGSCPHGRCAFCAENGARAQQTQRQGHPREQAEEAIRFARRRYRAKKFMLYIQAFTADLTDPRQQEMILQLLEQFDFSALSIGTRPDCLPAAALHFLDALQQQTEVWVELGVQTVHDATLERIQRGHNWACSQRAIRALDRHGVRVVAHIILGLPGETKRDWSQTADELAQLPISGIKIHNLHIMKGTALAQNPPAILNHWEYAEGVIDVLRRTPASIPVLRISTDTPPEQLIAPRWPLEKGQFIDYVVRQMQCRQLTQGDLLSPTAPAATSAMKPVATGDGSITFFSTEWKEHYHTQTGARLEALHKFIEPAALSQKLATRDIHLLDVCFGLGNNSLAALCAAAGAPHSLCITALELDRRVVCATAEHFQPLPSDPIDWKNTLQQLLATGQCAFSNIPAALNLHWGDARYLIQQLDDDSVDLVFHDPFSTQRCPELWTTEFFCELARVLKPDGVLCTYSSATPVRGAMRGAGLQIAQTNPGHNMGPGTIASRAPLPDGFEAIGPLNPRRAIAYRDPDLCAPAKAILRRRQERIEQWPKL